MSKILALLAKLPAESASVDWLGGAIVLCYVAAYFLGVPADQLPSLIDAALAAVAFIGVRGASLTVKRKAALGAGLDLAKAIADVRAGKPIPPQLADDAVELVTALADANTSPIDVPPPPPFGGGPAAFVVLLAFTLLGCGSMAGIDRASAAIERGSVLLDVVVEQAAEKYAEQVQARTQLCEAQAPESQAAFERCMAPFDAEARAKVESALERLVASQGALHEVTKAASDLRDAMPEVQP